MVNLRTLQSVAVRGKAALCVGVERFVLARSMGVIACTHDIPPATKEGRLPGGMPPIHTVYSTDFCCGVLGFCGSMYAYSVVRPTPRRLATLVFGIPSAIHALA